MTGLRRHGVVAVLVALCFRPPPLPAAEGGALVTEQAFLADLPIVLSATRLPQLPRDTPASVTIIDREMIAASGALDLPDVLRLVPGFQVGHVSGYQTTVTYHGLADAYARRMQVLVDGRSIYTPVFGGVLWAELPLAIEDIERIEVIRGPNAATYGSNSFAAVINIITRHPAQDPGTFGKATYGDIDTRMVVARHGASVGPFTWRLTAGYREDTGFPAAAEEDGRKNPLLSFRGDYAASARDSVELHAGLVPGRRGSGSWQDALADPPREAEFRSSFEQLRWRRSLGDDNEISLLFYHNYYRLADTYQTALLSEILGVAPVVIPILFSGRPDQALTVAEDWRAERFDLEFQHNLRVHPDVRLVWGAEARLDRAWGSGWFNTAQTFDTRLQRLFANAEWRPAPAWVVNAGAMYERNDLTGSDVSPRLGINYYLAPGHTVRASVSRAFRIPALVEDRGNAAYRFADGTPLQHVLAGNPELRPERMTSYELGYVGKLAAGLALDARIYREEVRDGIAVVLDPGYPDLLGDGTDTFVNDGFTDTTGAEVQASWHATAKTRVILSHAYAHQRGRIRLQLSPPLYWPTEETVPLHTTSLLAIHRFPFGIEGSLAYYRRSSMQWLSCAPTGCASVGGYNSLDLRLAHRFRAGATRGQVSVVGQSLMGDYADFRFPTMPASAFDKRFFLALELQFP